MDNKTNTRTGRWRPYDQLTMADEFLFDKMMQNPEICKGVLERILESGITNFAFSKSGECMDITYRGTDARVFVRMLDDTNTYYEPDTGRWGMAGLPRRMRFDVTTTDIFLCENVCVQDDLQELIVVYICPFDCFGEGKAKYVIRSCCEGSGKVFRDGSTRIILNTAGSAGTKELQAFLDYLEGKGDPEDPFIQMLEQAAANVRRDLSWQTEYRHYVARMTDIREQELVAHRLELEAYRYEVERGYEERIQRSIRSLLSNNIPEEEVKRLLDVTDEDIRMAQKK